MVHNSPTPIKMYTQAPSREVGSQGITVNNVQPGPIDMDLNPASGDWAVPQKAATALDRYGTLRRSPLTVDGGMNA